MPFNMNNENRRRQGLANMFQNQPAQPAYDNANPNASFLNQQQPQQQQQPQNNFFGGDGNTLSQTSIEPGVAGMPTPPTMGTGNFILPQQNQPQQPNPQMGRRNRFQSMMRNPRFRDMMRKRMMMRNRNPRGLSRLNSFGY